LHDFEAVGADLLGAAEDAVGEAVFLPEQAAAFAVDGGEQVDEVLDVGGVDGGGALLGEEPDTQGAQGGEEFFGFGDGFVELAVGGVGFADGEDVGVGDDRVGPRFDVVEVAGVLGEGVTALGARSGAAGRRGKLRI
jgi:hypothetical protein